MYKKTAMTCILAAVLLAVMAFAAAAGNDIDTHRECTYCGMDRKAYGFSRMLVRYEDGSEVGTCSLHCTVTELEKHRDKRVRSLLVADRDTRALIEAETAVWVMGGSKRGVMTMRPTWAFGTRSAAQAFVTANGGEIVGWKTALEAARLDAAPPSRR
ncbi:nitrous oxide reductase accessory protein NosL [Geobacter sp. SVR]|uniref:nitrous oxide reductase accessory protein NosL n=1 Tax=Geobacter sp. SVR TaxID=2495594 RepID=UPI00143EF8C4|nr:nitrous oxide reductase accessory protein NosL [Geobacter sp. SVR]BCS55333.1 NosL family protein [Geobacter sp. SVR]GCF87258.1 NosL family protein [Geobacter sp. SVR]